VQKSNNRHLQECGYLPTRDPAWREKNLGRRKGNGGGGGLKQKTVRRNTPRPLIRLFTLYEPATNMRTSLHHSQANGAKIHTVILPGSAPTLSTSQNSKRHPPVGVGATETHVPKKHAQPRVASRKKKPHITVGTREIKPRRSAASIPLFGRNKKRWKGLEKRRTSSGTAGTSPTKLTLNKKKTLSLKTQNPPRSARRHVLKKKKFQ